MCIRDSINDVKGANVSFVNYSEGDTLVDVGAANLSEVSTVQVGIFNKTTKIEGVQIGLINCADNGFFPCFPIVNFAKESGRLAFGSTVGDF